MPMKTITRCDVVSSHLLRKASTELFVNSISLGVYGYCLGMIAAEHIRSLPDDILIEILSRLPVKSLMQFKSVCKHWLFLIKQDIHLINLHSTRSESRPNLLYINPMPEKVVFGTSFDRGKTLQQSITCAEMIEGINTGVKEEQLQSIISKVRITDDKWPQYNHVLEPVNGLVCFVDDKTSAVMVYNASTREASPLVESTLLAEENQGSKLEIKSHRNPIHRFGFDPEKKEHKVFCFWRLISRDPGNRHSSSLDRHNYEIWEAMTLGRDTNWRRINAVPNENNQIKIKEALPPINSWRRQLYANGTIYWSNKEYRSAANSYSNPDDPAVIVAFDVGSETYRVIPIPNFILDEPRDKNYRLAIGMLVLGTHVALLYQMEPCVVKLWMLDDGADKKVENCARNIKNWSSETITLRFCCDGWIGASAIAGSSDKILFERRLSDDPVKYSCLYSYDRKSNTCNKIEMDGDSSFTRHHFSRSIVTTITESLFPVQPLNKAKVTS